MAEKLNLHSLKPAQSQKDRKRVGRGMGSGKGRYSGRGIKGQKSRAGSHKMRAGFEDGAEVTPESLVEKGLLKNTKTDVKLLGTGELKKKLTVRVHAISASAREKVEAAGGSVSLLREPKRRKPKHTKPKPAAAPEPEASAGPESKPEPEPEAAEAEEV